MVFCCWFAAAAAAAGLQGLLLPGWLLPGLPSLLLLLLLLRTLRCLGLQPLVHPTFTKSVADAVLFSMVMSLVFRSRRACVQSNYACPDQHWRGVRPASFERTSLFVVQCSVASNEM